MFPVRTWTEFLFDWPASVSNILTVRKWAEPNIVGRNFTSRIRPSSTALLCDICRYSVLRCDGEDGGEGVVYIVAVCHNGPEPPEHIQTAIHWLQHGITCRSELRELRPQCTN